ncbi:MAG: type IV toxin-antitoxin system AbiEi family antitoxin [Candidatus Omnitrophota bacterium]|nr:type IV toxin-antitoxin system AbiEi family antitoxin [Candidatus Omnitrophota bacterium]
MNNPTNMKNIFADKATFILRKMLSDPQKKWVTRDFTGDNGVSIGLAQGALETMAKKGYIERVKRGPNSYALLTNIDELISDWVTEYRFELNEVDTYYSPDKNILPKLKDYLKDKQYAFTLHSGANLVTSFVVTDQVCLYLEPEDWKKDVLELRQQLDLKELVRGGNIHIIRPHYKKSVFYGAQAIKGYKVVSNLQLYLDLYNYKPRGREHADYLKKVLEEKGTGLYES